MVGGRRVGGVGGVGGEEGEGGGGERWEGQRRGVGGAEKGEGQRVMDKWLRGRGGRGSGEGWEGQRERGGRSRGGGVRWGRGGGVGGERMGGEEGEEEGGGEGGTERRGGRGRGGGRCNVQYTNYMAPVNDQLPTVHSVYISLLPPPTHINTQGDHTLTIRCSTGRGSHVKWLDQSAAALDDTHQCPSHGGSRYLRNRKQVM